jgi:hypothetical protein
MNEQKQIPDFKGMTPDEINKTINEKLDESVKEIVLNMDIDGLISLGKMMTNWLNIISEEIDKKAAVLELENSEVTLN